MTTTTAGRRRLLPVSLLAATLLTACSTSPDWLDRVRPQGTVAVTDYYHWLSEAPADELQREQQRFADNAAASRSSIETVQQALLLSAAQNNPQADRARATQLLEILLDTAPLPAQGREKEYLIFAELWLQHLYSEAELARSRTQQNTRGEEIRALQAEISRLQSSLEAFATIEQTLVENESDTRDDEAPAPPSENEDDAAPAPDPAPEQETP